MVTKILSNDIYSVLFIMIIFAVFVCVIDICDSPISVKQIRRDELSCECTDQSQVLVHRIEYLYICLMFCSRCLKYTSLSNLKEIEEEEIEHCLNH